MEFQEQKLEQFKGQPRLPEFAVPKHYDLTIKLDLSACTFSGRVLIDVSIIGPTKFLVLNSLKLLIHQVSFTNSLNQKYVPYDVVVDSDDEILVLVFEEVLDAWDSVSYMDEGEKKNMVATQFEAVDARRCLPCWDEPALKATFKITLENIPSELTALSNMPISEEKFYYHLKTVRFEESILMSTYLVAIVVGLFDYVEDITKDGIKVRAYCPVGKSEKGKFALTIAVETLDFYKMYFSMPYPLPKLDMVAVPEFSDAAMENYGLITYREAELLQDPLHSAAANIQRLAIVVAHEVAHHWFGNLVTMEWWTDLWLKEGFATWVSYLAIVPEWKIWNRFLFLIKDGLRMDALEQSHSIEVEIEQAGSVLEYFDAISYKKGSSVIRMLENYLGNDIFQKSLGSYIKRYAYKNAKTEDLWSVLSETSKIEVNKIMNTWTKQKGYPLISVKLNDSTLEFEQTQLLSSSVEYAAQWIVPLTLSFSSYNKQERFLLETKLGKMEMGDDFCDSKKAGENWWIKLNVHQSGFCRVKYDNNLAAQLQEAVASNFLSAADEFAEECSIFNNPFLPLFSPSSEICAHDIMHVSIRLYLIVIQVRKGILDDMYALSEACLTPFSSLPNLMETYKKDLEYIVLSRLIDVCYNASKISREAIPELAYDLKQFFINLLLSHAEKLGWDVTPGESQLNGLIREEVLVALASFDHPQTKEKAIKRFQAYLEDPDTSLLPVDTRKAAYVVVMRNTSSADRSGLKCLQKIYKEVAAVQEKIRILRCIGSCPDPVIVAEILDFLLTDEVPHQDVIYVLSGISWEGRATAWTWFKANWNLIMKKWGTETLLTYFVRDIITPFCSHEMANEAEEFFTSHPVPCIALNLKQGVELVRIKARWIEHIKQEQQLLGELIKRLVYK
ncbi:Puromycin-sensitive aminopeptidase [Handroanthus impetiginosus]|uniref:Aminopeptidase n=1 Tax=Handroanthus impetiginosus TaxID=429701 RepID=A0A2G9HXQ2_9LAMI|nr:Puromycin-sensitive aminopeptidase [Handroanthus impetiginosus]